MKYVVEKIENDMVCLMALDTDEQIFVKNANLPSEIYEGVILTKNANNTYTIDTQTTKDRLDHLTTRMNTLFNKEKKQR